MHKCRDISLPVEHGEWNNCDVPYSINLEDLPQSQGLLQIISYQFIFSSRVSDCCASVIFFKRFPGFQEVDLFQHFQW